MQHPDCLQGLRHGNLIHAQKTLDPLNLPQKIDGAMPSSRDVPLELYLASPNGQQKLTDFTVKTSWFPRDFRLDQCIEGHGAGVGDIHGICVYIYI